MGAPEVNAGAVPAETRGPLSTHWFPVVRSNNKDENTGTWMEALPAPPKVVSTGIDFAFQIFRGRREHSLRERLGVPPSTVVLTHGQVRSEALERVWDGYEDFLAWAVEESVDGVLTPEFVKDDAPDLERSFAFYRAMVDAGLSFPVFQHPGAQPKRRAHLLQECYDFAESEQVRWVAHSVGRDRGRGGLLPVTARDHKLSRERYPQSVDFLHFGTSTPLRMKMAAKMLGYFDGEHGITFSNVVASTAAAFFLRLPERATAGPDMSKGQVFAHNVASYERMAERVLAKSPRPRPRRPLRRRALAR